MLEACCSCCQGMTVYPLRVEGIISPEVLSVVSAPVRADPVPSKARTSDCQSAAIPTSCQLNRMGVAPVVRRPMAIALNRLLCVRKAYNKQDHLSASLGKRPALLGFVRGRSLSLYLYEPFLIRQPKVRQIPPGFPELVTLSFVLPLDPQVIPKYHPPRLESAARDVPFVAGRNRL